MIITKIPKPVYLNNWASFVDVVADFNGFYLSSDEYNNGKITATDNSYMAEKKEKMTAILKSDDFKGVNIILASYGNACYTGDAFVLFEKNGKLYEVHGSHCSCYGLEDQWSPEESDIDSLEHRAKNGNLGKDNYADNVFQPELIKALKYLRRHNK